MGEKLDYGGETTAQQTFAAMGAIGLLLALMFGILNLGSVVQDSARSLVEPLMPIGAVLGWRVIALLFGLAAIVSMFRSGPGNMQVLLHEQRSMTLLHPVGFQKFVTFSSWTLLSNILYFASVSVASVLHINGSNVPFWLETMEIGMFAVACGSAFLTATIVRYIILPDLFASNRSSDHIFLYHEQAMHNLAAIFLAVEVVLVAPKLHPYLALFCVGMGLVYVCFAYIFAYRGGGYYVYSFIDPRLRYAPFTMLGLAFAIAVFFLGVLIASMIVEMNTWLGALLLAIWVSLIVQFTGPKPEDQSSS